jgi:uncharacterized membrane protein
VNHIQIAAPLPVLIPALAIWLFAAWLSFANWRRSARGRAAGRLESLRFILLTLLVLTLLRPEYVERLQRKLTPEIAILMDASDSMKTRDLTLTNKAVSRAQWLADCRASQFWLPLQSKAKVTVEDFAAASTNANAINGTDLNDALEKTLLRYKNLKAVLLLTDGDWNLGKSPLATATRYREQNIPIFTVAVGRETPMPDLILENVSMPAYGILGEDIAVPFKVTSHLDREVRTTVAIYDGQVQQAKKDITIPPNGAVEDAILWSPKAGGEITGIVKVPVEAEESIAENNEHSFHISIRQEKLKVLVVDSLPRWEYRYLRNALARDPGVDMQCLLFHPEIGPGDGPNYIPAFPATKEALAPYDVIFLGDVGIGQNELTETNAAMIRGLVEQQASGLVFVPGQRGREATFSNSPLADLYPVVLDPARPLGIPLQNEAQLTLTSAGKGHWLTRFDSDEDRNFELWKQLPGFFWSAAVEKSRPGSEVLAVHSTMRNEFGRMPLLVTRSAGAGKVLFLGTDSAWRWRRGVEDKFHYRFWGQVVRWMAHLRHLSEKDGIRLNYTPETPQAGDTAFLQTTVLDAAGFPIDKGPVTGKITSPSGRTERLEFAPIEGGWGVFKSSFAAQEIGPYKIEVASEAHGRHLEAALLVAPPLLEKLGQPVNARILREISAVSQGASFTTDEFDNVVKQISLLPEPGPVEKRVRLWSDPRWGGAILVLLAVYWVGRKWAGLI